MIKELDKFTSAMRNPFMLLSFLIIAFILLFFIVLNQQANLPSFLLLPLLIFLGGSLSIFILIFFILLIFDPNRLFIEQLDDLKKDHEQLIQTTFDINERLITAESALLPIIRGVCPSISDRLNSNHIVIGAKQFDEQIILGHILAGWVKSELSMNCEKLIPNGGTLKNFADLINGWIDGYIEYTGTGCMLLKIDPTGLSLEQVVAKLDEESRKRYNVAWLKPLGLRNNYRIVVRSDKAKALHLNTISDLTLAANQLTFCSGFEFINRTDGLIGLQRRYGIHFRNIKVVSTSEKYDLLKTGGADITVGFETDTELKNSDLTILEDSNMFFPEYYAVPVFRVEALEIVKNLEQTLLRLENQISSERMVEMISIQKSRGTDHAIPFELASEFIEQLSEQDRGNNFV